MQHSVLVQLQVRYSWRTESNIFIEKLFIVMHKKRRSKEVKNTFINEYQEVLVGVIKKWHK